MTESEAIELLKKANRNNDTVCILPKSDMGKCLIKALEKQIPKKPIKSKEQKIRYVNTYYCPTCNLGFTGFNIAKWCYHCGQKLDWSDK
ncbi:MAG: hypothetical protein ACLUVO_07905 [Roseburia sp.]